MSYVDGFVIPVPADRRDAFVRGAAAASAVFREHGATRVVECWGDDLPEGKVTDFRRSVMAEPGETVVFSWITWPSKAVRDAAQPKIMADPRMQPGALEMPFDGRRMIFGGFEPVFDSGG